MKVTGLLRNMFFSKNQPCPKNRGEKKGTKKKGSEEQKKIEGWHAAMANELQEGRGSISIPSRRLFANLKVKGSLGLIWAKASTILSSRPFIPLSVFHSF